MRDFADFSQPKRKKKKRTKKVLRDILCPSNNLINTWQNAKSVEKSNRSEFLKAVQKRIDWLITRVCVARPNSSAFMSYGWYNENLVFRPDQLVASQTDQIDHVLARLYPKLPIWYAGHDLCSTDLTQETYARSCRSYGFHRGNVSYIIIVIRNISALKRSVIAAASQAVLDWAHPVAVESSSNRGRSFFPHSSLAANGQIASQRTDRLSRNHQFGPTLQIDKR